MLVSAIEVIIAAGTTYCKGAVEPPSILVKTTAAMLYAPLEVVTLNSGATDEVSRLFDGFFTSSFFHSPMPSRMLEQLAQILGFRDRAFPPIDIG